MESNIDQIYWNRSSHYCDYNKPYILNPAWFMETDINAVSYEHLLFQRVDNLYFYKLLKYGDKNRFPACNLGDSFNSYYRNNTGLVYGKILERFDIVEFNRIKKLSEL